MTTSKVKLTLIILHFIEKLYQTLIKKDWVNFNHLKYINQFKYANLIKPFVRRYFIS